MNWRTESEDTKFIVDIVSRARELLTKEWDKLQAPAEMLMDITAVHANGCPLDLKKLLEYSDFDFSHDVTGIFINIDRSSGGLKNQFRPRCALKNQYEHSLSGR